MIARRDVAVLALYTDHKEVLLQHRSKDAPRLPNYWGFFGGGIENGESPEQALRREILEELEYELDAPELLLTQKFIDNETENTKFIFVEKYDPRKKLVLHEGQAMKWCHLEDPGDGAQIADHDQIALAKLKDFFKL